MSTENEIRNLWLDPSFSWSFTGLLTFKNELFHQKNITITQKDLQKILNTIPHYLQNTIRKKSFLRRPYFIHGWLQLVQADLGSMYESNGFKWIFVAVDVYTSYLWAWPLKNKTSSTIQEKFDLIFKRGYPQKIETDQDKYLKLAIFARSFIFFLF